MSLDIHQSESKDIYQSNKACGIIEHKNLEVIKKGANFRSSPRIVQLLNDIQGGVSTISAFLTV